MDIEIKRLHPDAIIPDYQTAGAAAMDLHVCIQSPLELRVGEPAQMIPLGFAIHIKEPSVVGLVLPRSGMGHKLGLLLGNGTGVIDSDYQGPMMISAWNRNTPLTVEYDVTLDGQEPEGSLAINDGHNIIIEPGDRIAQILFVPIVRANFVLVSEFAEATARGAGGFGSTGAGRAA